jgi:hypothetical protein
VRDPNHLECKYEMAIVVFLVSPKIFWLSPLKIRTNLAINVIHENDEGKAFSSSVENSVPSPHAHIFNVERTFYMYETHK